MWGEGGGGKRAREIQFGCFFDWKESAIFNVTETDI